MYGCLPSEAVRLRQRCCFSSLNTCWVYLWFIQVWGILLPFLFWPYFLYLSSCILLSVWLLDSTWLLQLENRSTPFSSRLRGQAHWDAFVKSETPHKASRNCSVQPVRRVSRGECSFMKCLWTRVFRFGPFFPCELLMCPVACGSSIVNFFYASKNFNKFWFNISDSIFSTTHVCTFSHVWLFQLFATPWTSGSSAHQGPLSMGFPRQEYWSGLPFPTPGDLPHPGIKPVSLVSLALAGGFFTTEPPGNSKYLAHISLTILIFETERSNFASLGYRLQN